MGPNLGLPTRAWDFKEPGWVYQNFLWEGLRKIGHFPSKAWGTIKALLWLPWLGGVFKNFPSLRGLGGFLFP